MLQITEDTYNGVIVETSSLPQSLDEFTAELELLVQSISSKSLLWIQIPIEKSELVPILTQHGFVFHNCEQTYIMLVKKLQNNAIIPTTKNYIVGVGAIVFHANTILVVQDVLSNSYKLPGGHIEKNESIQQALQREVFEETGVHVQFESIVNIGHFRHGQFGESNLYIVCTAKPVNTTIAIQDIAEIREARWLAIDEFLESKTANMYNKSVVTAALSNVNLKLTLQDITLKVRDAEVFF